jgi:hypothetical protein
MQIGVRFSQVGDLPGEEGVAFLKLIVLFLRFRVHCPHPLELGTLLIDRTFQFR